MYVAMERNTDNGVDTKNYACDRLGIVMRISIINYTRHEADKEGNEDNLPRNTQVLK